IALTPNEGTGGRHDGLTFLGTGVCTIVGGELWHVGPDDREHEMTVVVEHQHAVRSMTELLPAHPVLLGNGRDERPCANEVGACLGTQSTGHARRRQPKHDRELLCISLHGGTSCRHVGAPKPSASSRSPYSSGDISRISIFLYPYRHFKCHRA